MSDDKKPQQVPPGLTEALSSTRWYFVYRDPETCPKTLTEAFCREIPHIAPDSWPKRIAWGGAFYNGRPARGDLELQVPCWIEYFEPKASIESAENFFAKITSANIVYEDEDLLVVFKPAGLSCLPNREQTHFNLKRWLCDYLHSQGRETQPHLPSRLDTSTSGLVITSVSRRMHTVLQHAFERRTIEKTYVMEVVGLFPPGLVHCERPIGKDPRHPILRKTASDGLTAKTLFACEIPSKFTLQSGEEVATSLVKAFPKTGRTHQIRVHAAELGFPIIGDPFYDGAKAESLHLLCYSLEFQNPFRGTIQRFKVPAEFLPAWCEQLNDRTKSF